ncbi:AcrR family transcriptional regulator [Nocardia sp. GAS34]|uniref:TetR/AcrR family transcriptional regulator n=1 Tax=unclassified Nocardia TaxID=2637762 RepID=UPI003D1AEFEE
MATTDSAQRSGELARARIVEIAFEHFARHGYRGSSLARVAAEADISQSGLLHHFSTKDALLQAVLGARDLRDLVATGTSHEDLAVMDFDALLGFLTRVVRNNAGNRAMVRLAHVTSAEAVDSDHPAHAWVEGRMKFLHTLIADALRRSMNAGVVRPDLDTRCVAELLVAVVTGLESQWLVDADIDMVGSFEKYVAQLRDSVAISA